MDDFVKNMFQPDRIIPPEECVAGLVLNFKDAMNVDWSEKESGFEAVFYKDESEYIAVFDPSGILLEYKQYVSTSFLPQPIRELLESKGEIMNTVLRNKGNRIEFEAIIRDLDQLRYLLILSESGSIIEEGLL